MSLGKYLTARRSFFFMIAGLLAFFLYLYFFVGFNQIFPFLGQINYASFLFFYSLAIVSTLGGLLLFALSWRELLATLSIKISLSKAFQYNTVGNFVDLVVPCQTVCGEVTRVQLIYREGRDNYGRILSSAFVNRILINIIYVFGLSVGILFIIATRSAMLGFLMGPLLIFLIGTVLYNFVLIVMIVKPGTAKRLFSAFLRFVAIVSLRRFKREKLLARAEGPLLNFEEGFQVFRDNPKSLIMPAVMLFFSWVLGIVSFILVFFALGFFFLPVDFYFVGFSLTISIQGIVAALSVGALDIFMTQFLNLYRITIGASSIAVVLLRFVVFWFHIFIGYAIIQLVGARNLLSSSSDQKKK